MYERMEIKSHKGPYSVFFEDNAFNRLDSNVSSGNHFIIDKRVASIYESELDTVLQSPSVLLIEATELNKTLDKFTGYVEHLRKFLKKYFEFYNYERPHQSFNGQIPAEIYYGKNQLRLVG